MDPSKPGVMTHGMNMTCALKPPPRIRQLVSTPTKTPWNSILNGLAHRWGKSKYFE